MSTEPDVHTEHCCARHGCKYSDGRRCTVVTGQKPQSYPCETCDSPMVQLHDAIDAVLAADHAYEWVDKTPDAYMIAIKNLRTAIANLRRVKNSLKE